MLLHSLTYFCNGRKMGISLIYCSCSIIAVELRAVYNPTKVPLNRYHGSIRDYRVPAFQFAHEGK